MSFNSLTDSHAKLLSLVPVEDINFQFPNGFSPSNYSSQPHGHKVHFQFPNGFSPMCACVISWVSVLLSIP